MNTLIGYKVVYKDRVYKCIGYYFENFAPEKDADVNKPTQIKNLVIHAIDENTRMIVLFGENDDFKFIKED